MSTRGSLQYLWIGSHRRPSGPLVVWHLYHECRDDTVHLELEVRRRVRMNVTLGPFARACLRLWCRYTPWAIWRRRQDVRWWNAHKRRIAWKRCGGTVR